MAGMTIEECESNIGKCVRISRPAGKNQHKGRGKLTGVDGKKALVLPFGGHKKEEPMDPELLTLWKSRNSMNREIRLNRDSEDDVNGVDADVAALLSKNGSNGHDPWSHKPQSGRKKKDKRKGRPVQMDALPPESPVDILKQPPRPSLPQKPLPKPNDKRITIMNKHDWLRKHCGTIFDCLVNGIHEAFPGSEHKASTEATERILQTLVGDTRFIALDDEVLPRAIPVINEFAREDLDESQGEITRADLEDLLVEKQILKRQKQIDPLSEIRSGNLDRKEVLRALIGPDGFKSTSELATFVLRELRGVKAE